MRDILIGTGFCCSKETAEDSLEFAEVWRRTNSVAPVVVVDNSPVGCGNAYGDARIIRIFNNLGHYIYKWRRPDAIQGSPWLCGWSISWMLPALAAYSEDLDFVYIEQDCLCVGDWIGRLRSDIESTGCKALIGPPSGAQSSETSFFWVDRDYVSAFIRSYLSRPGDNAMLVEEKMLNMINSPKDLVGFHSIGPGRERPIPAEGAFSVQPSAEERLNGTKHWYKTIRGIV